MRRWMRRLDHSMIFFLIAGTYTPFALLVLHGAARRRDPRRRLDRRDRRRDRRDGLDRTPEMGRGADLHRRSAGSPSSPSRSSGTRWASAGTLLVAAGGLLYTAGAVVYATQRPNPNPRVFGYHEVFHLLRRSLAAAAHFAAIAFFALPARLAASGRRLLGPPARRTSRRRV